MDTLGNLTNSVVNVGGDGPSVKRVSLGVGAGARVRFRDRRAAAN